MYILIHLRSILAENKREEQNGKKRKVNEKSRTFNLAVDLDELRNI